MKTTLRFAFAAIFAALLTTETNAQPVPEMVFRNPQLISGASGQNGAKYKFSNVISGPNAVDAIVEIRGRSASNVQLRSIDNNSDGWDKAFQPELGINGNIAPNTVWWMEFRMEFFKSGTNQKQEIEKFYITALDIDGDGNRVREWQEFKKVKNVATSQNNFLVTNLLNTVLDLLNLNNSGSDVEVTGPYTNFSSIDTAATSVMATYQYENKDRIEFRLGGRKSNSSGSAAGMRMNSLWFKSFTLDGPIETLPVKLIDFTATVNNSKVDLRWTTAGEKNVSHFEVQRSVDGTNYNQVGLVFAYGNTSDIKKYEFPNDITGVQANAVFYRLRSVDVDGKYEYSEVRIIRPDATNNNIIALSAYPNPVMNELRVTLPASWQNKPVQIGIYSQNGLQVGSISKSRASQTENIQVSQLPTGHYVVRAICQGEVASRMIIKN